jgi:aspartate racemase
MKTIGVLGGLGPQATMDFEARVHKVAQKLIPQRENSGYPPMVVYYWRLPPMIFDQGGKPVTPFQVHPELLQATQQLGKLADFMVITANGPYLFIDELALAAGREVLNLIDLTLAEVEKRGWKKVGVLGLGEPRIYLKPLEEKGIECITLQRELRDRLDQAIFKVMEGSDGEAERSVTIEAIDFLRGEGVEGIIPGCTEIPLLLREEMEAEDLVNPAQLLAEAAVKNAIEVEI